MNDRHDLLEQQLDAEITAALADMLHAAPGPEAGPRDVALLGDVSVDGQRSVWWMAAVAATVLLVGVGGLVVLRPTSPPEVSEPLVEPTPTLASDGAGPESSGTAAPPTSRAPSATSLPPVAASAFDDPVGLYLPTASPPGYQIDSLTASEPVSPFGTIRFVRFDEAGVSVEASLGVRFLAPEAESGEDNGVEFEADATVRGVPAQVSHIGPRSDAEPEQAGVMWVEDGMTMSSSSTGLSAAEVVAATEALLIDVPERTVELPEQTVGLVAVDDVSVMPANAVTSTVNLSPMDGRSGGFVSFGSQPNTLGLSLEVIVDEFVGGSGAVWEPREIDGRTFYVQEQPADGLGPFTSLVWLDGPFKMYASGRAAPEDVIAFAAGLIPVDREAFSSVGAFITVRALALDEIDRVEFDDGVVVSVRALRAGADGTGASAMCLEAPIMRCTFQIGESSIIGEFQTSVFETFDLGGRVITLGWQNAAEVERAGDPVLGMSGNVFEPGASVPTETNSTIVQQVTTSSGRFIEIQVADGEAPPSVNFETDGQVNFGVTADLDGPLDF